MRRPLQRALTLCVHHDVVELVNTIAFGNCTAIFTRDGGVVCESRFDVQADMVGIKVPIPAAVAHFSFGGWKQSLFGDRHIQGSGGVEFNTRNKLVTARWPNPATSTVDLGFLQTR